MRNAAILLIIFVLISLSSETFSQCLGVKAGLNLSTIHSKNKNSNINLKPGFHLGVTAELPIDEIFTFNPELLLSSKGYIYNPKAEDIGGGQTIDLKEKANIYYLEIPLLAKTTFKIGKNKIYFNLGPYVSIGLFGNIVSESKSSIDFANGSSKTKISWGGENYPSYNRFDYGIASGGGIEIKAFRIGLSYDLGLAQTIPNTMNDNKITNQVIGISVGYKFYSN
jgi:hypothetical protein